MINPNLQLILDATQPKIEEMVEFYIKNHKDIPTEYELELYKLGLVIDLIKVFGRYISKTDNIKILSIGIEKGVIVFSLNVTRSEKTHYMKTSMIIAGGYNIQIRHYRYIVDTTLPVNNLNPDFDTLKDKKRKLENSEKARIELLNKEKNYQIQLEKFEEKKKLTKEDIYKKSYLTDDYTWERLNEYAKETYKTKELFDLYVISEKERVWNNHLEQISDKRLKALKAPFEKDIQKLKQKIIK